MFLYYLYKFIIFIYMKISMNVPVIHVSTVPFVLINLTLIAAIVLQASRDNIANFVSCTCG